MKKYYFLFMFLFLQFHIYSQFECDTEESDIEISAGDRSSCSNYRNNFENVPTGTNSVPLKDISLIFHILQDDDGNENFSESQQDVDYLYQVVENLNDFHNSLILPEPQLPSSCEQTFVPSSKIKFTLKAIKYYQSSDFICTDTKCGARADEVFDYCVTNNVDLTDEEKNNYFPVIMVGWRGERVNEYADCNDDGCDVQYKWLAGRGPSSYSIIRGIYANQWNTSGINEILAHEIGHSFSLSHSWVGCCDTGNTYESNNVMDYDEGPNTPLHSFASCQLGAMHYTIENTFKNKYLSNDLCVKQATKIIIPENTEVHWMTEEIVSEDVEIYGSLKITCEVKVADDVKFTVFRGGKLEIDGGRIYGCNEWQGIIVEGDAENFSQANAGNVELLNQAKIEQAVNAISMNPIHIPWPETPKYYGGLVTATDANFINCRRAVQFMKYGTGIIKDESSFTNCTFDNMKYAITIWADNGVKINNCSFNNITDYAVHPYNSEVFIENGCTFENMPMGVNILYTYPQPFAPHIGNQYNDPNDFSCYEYGVHATSTGSTDALDIVNNNFLGGQVGIHVNGDSYFEVHHNDLLGYTNTSNEEAAAINAISTGFFDNGIFENNISSSLYGSHAVWENPGLRYAFNCFDFNLSADVFVNQGSIHPFQEGDRYEDNGDEFTEAGNCFSNGSIPEIDNTGNDTINYYLLPSIQSGDCKFLDNAVNVNPEDGSAADLLAACGSVNSPGNINVVSFCGGPFSSKQDIMDKIASIEAYIAQIESTTYPSEAYKKYLLAKYNRCLVRLLAQVGIVILEPEVEPENDPDGVIRMEEFISLYSARPEFSYQMLAYGMMLQLNDINRARTYLNSLATDTEEKQDFVWAQNINLDYLENPLNYILDGNDEAILYGKAIKSFPLAGYARSIYEVLTKIKVDLELPERPKGAHRNVDFSEEEFSINSFPNPVKDIFSIIVSGGDNDSKYQAVIMDATGKVAKKLTLENSAKKDLDLSDFYNGVYFLSVKDNKGDILYSNKIVVIH